MAMFYRTARQRVRVEEADRIAERERHEARGPRGLVREDQAAREVHDEVAGVAAPEQRALDLAGLLARGAGDPRREHHAERAEAGLDGADDERVAKLHVVRAEWIPMREREAGLADSERAVGDRPAELPVREVLDLACGDVARGRRCGPRHGEQDPQGPDDAHERASVAGSATFVGGERRTPRLDARLRGAARRAPRHVSRARAPAT